MVVIGKKKIKTGFALYLDINHEGKRKKEYLKMRISGKTRHSEEDKVTLRIAEKIRAKRELEILSNQFNDKTISPKQKFFLPYLEGITQNSNFKKNTLKKWRHLKLHIVGFASETKTFQEINPSWLEKFKQYLLSKVSQNSADTYFATLKAALNKAVSDDIILANPMAKVNNIGRQKTLPKYLTLEEVKLLDSTPYGHNAREAFLFCCFTGLRYGDVKNLRWMNIVQDNGKHYIRFKQGKTSSDELLPISKQAIKYLGDFGDSQGIIFPLPDNTAVNRVLKRWARATGLNKRLTFHMSRHTFATLSLTHDVDLYTVSKLLGHSDIKVTQVYARVIDRKKEEAVQRLPEF